jgi:hypothetical protein
MHLNTWNEFRHAVYGCFLQGKDALFNLLDALLSECEAQSLIELSLSPHFQRTWDSVYEALSDGKIDERRLRELFLEYLARPALDQPLRIGIDASNIARPKAVTSPDRSGQKVPNLPDGEQAITYGWQFSTVVALPATPGSWTYVLDQSRIETSTTAAQVAALQLARLAPHLPKNTLAYMDRGYDSAWLWCQLSGLPITGTLIRLKGNRCFYRPAPPPTGKRGAPRKWGDKLQPSDKATHADPTGEWSGQDQAGRPVEVSVWQQMHLKNAAWLDVTVVRVVRPTASRTKRDPRTSWFVWIGDPQADVAQVALGYVHRFSQEHGYRFEKQSLLWDKPRVRTPEQFTVWSWLVAIAHNIIVLARDEVQAQVRPWENKQRCPSPQQVRRGLHKLLPHLGSPARPPQPRGKSAGRAKGTKLPKRTRYALTRQEPKVPALLPL